MEGDYRLGQVKWGNAISFVAVKHVLGNFEFLIVFPRWNNSSFTHFGKH